MRFLARLIAVGLSLVLGSQAALEGAAVSASQPVGPLSSLFSRAAFAPSSDDRAVLASRLSPFGWLRFPAESDPARPRVVLVHDVHHQIAAQSDIAAALACLARIEPGLPVGVEGAQGSIDVSAFRAFRDAPAVREATRFLFDHFGLSGSVASALLSPAPLRLVGIDDAALYRRNVEALRAAWPRRTEAEAERAALAADARRLSSRVFSPELAAFEARRERLARSGDIAARAQNALDGAPGGAYPALRAWIAALRDEAVARPVRVARELAGLRAEGVASALWSPAEALRAALLDARRRGVPAASLADVAAKARALESAERLDATAALEDLAAAEAAAGERRARTDEERRLFRLLLNLDRTASLIRFQLTPADWTALRTPDEAASPVSTALATLETRWAALPVSPFRSFYEVARARNAVLARMFLAAHPAAQRLSAVVVGGFHAPGLSRRLAAAGFEVLDFVPRHAVDGGEASLTAVLKGPDAVAAAFAADVATLAEPPLKATSEGLALRVAALDAAAGGSAQGAFDRLAGPGRATVESRRATAEDGRPQLETDAVLASGAELELRSHIADQDGSTVPALLDETAHVSVRPIRSWWRSRWAAAVLLAAALVHAAQAWRGRGDRSPAIVASAPARRVQAMRRRGFYDFDLESGGTTGPIHLEPNGRISIGLPHGQPFVRLEGRRGGGVVVRPAGNASRHVELVDPQSEKVDPVLSLQPGQTLILGRDPASVRVGAPPAALEEVHAFIHRRLDGAIIVYDLATEAGTRVRVSHAAVWDDAPFELHVPIAENGGLDWVDSLFRWLAIEGPEPGGGIALRGLNLSIDKVVRRMREAGGDRRDHYLSTAAALLMLRALWDGRPRDFPPVWQRVRIPVDLNRLPIDNVDRQVTARYAWTHRGLEFGIEVAVAFEEGWPVALMFESSGPLNLRQPLELKPLKPMPGIMIDEEKLIRLDELWSTPPQREDGGHGPRRRLAGLKVTYDQGFAVLHLTDQFGQTERYSFNVDDGRRGGPIGIRRLTNTRLGGATIPWFALLSASVAWLSGRSFESGRRWYVRRAPEMEALVFAVFPAIMVVAGLSGLWPLQSGGAWTVVAGIVATTAFPVAHLAPKRLGAWMAPAAPRPRAIGLIHLGHLGIVGISAASWLGFSWIHPLFAFGSVGFVLMFGFPSVVYAHRDATLAPVAANAKAADDIVSRVNRAMGQADARVQLPYASTLLLLDLGTAENALVWRNLETSLEPAIDRLSARYGAWLELTARALLAERPARADALVESARARLLSAEPRLRLPETTDLLRRASAGGESNLDRALIAAASLAPRTETPPAVRKLVDRILDAWIDSLLTGRSPSVSVPVLRAIDALAATDRTLAEQLYDVLSEPLQLDAARTRMDRRAWIRSTIEWNVLMPLLEETAFVQLAAFLDSRFPGSSLALSRFLFLVIHLLRRGGYTHPAEEFVGRATAPWLISTLPLAIASIGAPSTFRELVFSIAASEPAQWLFGGVWARWWARYVVIHIGVNFAVDAFNAFLERRHVAFRLQKGVLLRRAPAPRAGRPAPADWDAAVRAERALRAGA